MMCITPGTKKAIHQAKKSGEAIGPRIRSKMRGMISCVAPPPRFPQPAVMPLREPTISALKNKLIQYWHETNVASEKPMKKRERMKPTGVDTVDMQNTDGAVSITMKAQSYRGPMRSHRVPIRRREAMELETEAIPALLMSCLVRSRLLRMTGRRGAAAKLETKQVRRKSKRDGM